MTPDPLHTLVSAYLARARALGVRERADAPPDAAIVEALAGELRAAGCDDLERVGRVLLASARDDEWRPHVSVLIARYQLDGVDADVIWRKVRAACRPVGALPLDVQPDEAQLRAAIQALGGVYAVREMPTRDEGRAKVAAVRAYAAAGTWLAVRDSTR